ncbi:hypothetical protein L210DRAFT_3540977 [Boletus edulis BED1]|uniref:Uncharacterized protein n=1 Tax=Boletus edulis BED1 TaxID=1328754 RepID=A0AAD4GEU6_BOLED|nr:hypothetical protein L210DRAFT_3540977 [Boletus edulis BED1]
MAFLAGVVSHTYCHDSALIWDYHVLALFMKVTVTSVADARRAYIRPSIRTSPLVPPLLPPCIFSRALSNCYVTCFPNGCLSPVIRTTPPYSYQ